MAAVDSPETNGDEIGTVAAIGSGDGDSCAEGRWSVRNGGGQCGGGARHEAAARVRDAGGCARGLREAACSGVRAEARGRAGWLQRRRAAAGGRAARGGAAGGGYGGGAAG